MPAPSHPIHLLVRHSGSSVDATVARELLQHLGMLGRCHGVDVWTNDRIIVGGDLVEQVRRAIGHATVAVLLLSPDLLASNMLHDIELPLMLERARNGVLQVVLVLLRDCTWSFIPAFRNLPLLPKSGKSLAAHRRHQRDRVLTTLVQDLVAPATLQQLAGKARNSEPTASAPRQLRPPPADFVGRTAEIADILGNIGSGVLIAGLVGQGGIGKTALALQVAATLGTHYPDAHIAIDLQGASLSGQEPLSPTVVMMHVIHAFKPNQKRPETEAELVGQYRSVLHGKRALLLFDNARDAAQVEPLLPPTGCVVIITSRRKFALPGLYRKELDVLTLDDAASLVQKIAPRLDLATTAAITRLCGYLPLALRNAASALSEQDDLDPRGYVEQLRTATIRLELVEASLSVSLALLDPASSLLWTKLGVFPGDFTTEAAAAVAAADIKVIEQTLRKLRRHSLLEYTPTTKCYRMHDLSRVFALSKLNDTERHIVERRHAEYFLHFASSGEEEYYIPRLHIPWARHLLDIVNIRAGDAVLNVACGTGVLTRLAALRAGANGRVTGIDISAARVAEARAAPLPSSAAQVDFIESPAAPLPFRAEQFDVAVCHQGLQFLPDRAAALREMHRLLRPGGRLGVTIWAGFDDSTYFAAIVRAMQEVLPARVLAAVDALFSWTDLTSIRETVESAGFDSVQVAPHQLPIQFEGGVDQVLRSLQALPFGRELSSLPIGTRAAFKALLRDKLAPLMEREVVRGHVTANVVLATR